MQRNPWRRIALTVGAMAVVLLAAASYRFVASRGLFTSVNPVSPGICRAIAGIEGVGDIAVDAPSRTAFIAAVARTPSARDGLYSYAYETPGARPVKFDGTPKDFHPTALTQIRAPDGTVYLQALFHRNTGFTISLFKVKPGAVEELGRLSTDVLTDPADIAALDANRFYVINRHATHTALGRWLDDTFLLPRANVLYFDGMKFVTVAERLNSPAGIALSPDDKHLYVSEDYARTLVNFVRNEFTGGTDTPAVLPIGSGLGKISVAADDTLIIAARPKPGMGQVWRVKGNTAELLYARRDSEVAAAAQLGRHLLIGAADGLTDCSY